MWRQALPGYLLYIGPFALTRILCIHLAIVSISFSSSDTTWTSLSHELQRKLMLYLRLMQQPWSTKRSLYTLLGNLWRDMLTWASFTNIGVKGLELRSPSSSGASGGFSFWGKGGQHYYNSCTPRVGSPTFAFNNPDFKHTLIVSLCSRSK